MIGHATRYALPARAINFCNGVESRLVIAVRRTAGMLTDAHVLEANWQTVEDVADEFARCGESNETVELRLWDGTQVKLLSAR